MIKNWLICFNGYGQGNRMTSGLGKVVRLSRSECRNPKTRISLLTWNRDVDELVKEVVNQSLSYPNICVSGFSYGASTAVKFCEALLPYNYFKVNAYLIAPVWRTKDKWMSPWSLLDRWHIHTPNNIRNLVSWSQQTGVIKSHKVIADKATSYDSRSLNVRHITADRQFDVYNTIMEAHRVYL